MDDKERARERLRQLTGKPHVRFTGRGNDAIRHALRVARGKGRTRLLIPDQGGWLTYPDIGRELGYEVTEFKTDRAYIAPGMVVGDDKTALLINSMPAYAFTTPVTGIARRCEEQGILFINDASATIGTPEAKEGSIIIGSCNRWKPLPLLKGGFIAADEPLQGEEPILDYDRLCDLLESLPERCAEVFHAANRLKLFLEEEEVVRPDHKGYNVIVLCDGARKERLINKVKDFDASIEHTDCPRYIRVLESGVSFEVKRRFGE